MTRAWSGFGVLAASEMRDATRKRWIWTYVAAFAVLSGLLAYASFAGSGFSGEAGFGPTAAGMIDLQLVVVPLMALIAGGLAIARERERGSMAFVLSLPVAPAAYLGARFIGLATALTVAVVAGFGSASAVMAVMGANADPLDTAAVLGFTWLLALSMAAVGLAVSAASRSTPAALGIGVAVWLFFVLVGDLGLMAGSLVAHMGLRSLLFATIANPTEAYKIAAVAALSGSVDVLGPGGRLATDTFGSMLMPVLALSLVVWTLIGWLAAWLWVRHGDAV